MPASVTERSVRFIRNWNGRETGTVQSLGRGLMETLVERRIAVWNEPICSQSKAKRRGNAKRNVQGDQRAGD
jgi:hypothetical protein